MAAPCLPLVRSSGPSPADIPCSRATVRFGGALSGDRRERQVHAAETRLLYDNACTGIGATVVIAALLAYAQWNVKRPLVVLAWLLYVLLVSAARYMLVRWYRRASPGHTDSGRWSVAFTVGTAMAAAGWVAAAIMLYAPARPMNETFLVFVVGGVMLGGASLLAARPEAFLTFLLPTGLLTALRVCERRGSETPDDGIPGRRLHCGDAGDDAGASIA